MASSEQLLALVKQKGPVIPSNVSKAIGQNLIFTAAMLSELAARKMVKISNVKVGGGSPLYYTPEQAPKLVNFIEYLDEKEQRAVYELKEAKILRDNNLSPLTRVGLKAAKDFAVALEVTVGGNSEIFWKWYMTDDQEASQLIHNILAGTTPKPQPVEDAVATSQPQVEQPEPVQPELKPKPAPQAAPEPAPAVAPKPVEPASNVEEKKAETKVEEKPVEEKVEPKKAEKPKKQKKQSPPAQKVLTKTEIPEDEQSDFYKQVYKYFEEKEIEVLDQKVVRRSREYEFIIDLPSAVGNVSFVCIAKNKKSLSDGDLSTLFLTGQAHKLPILVLSDAKISKKATEMLKKELRGLTVVRLSE